MDLFFKYLNNQQYKDQAGAVNGRSVALHWIFSTTLQG
jgi:hypothetical protein